VPFAGVNAAPGRPGPAARVRLRSAPYDAPVRPGVLFAVLVRPRLWPEVWRTAWDFRCKEWWKRLLLVPESEYLRWRKITAYGDPGAPLTAGDVVRYLRWRRRQRVE